MKFADCISFLYDGEELERVYSAYGAPALSGMFSRKKTFHFENALKEMHGLEKLYLDVQNIENAIEKLTFHDDAEVSALFPVIIRDILLEKNDCCYEQNGVVLEVMEYEREILKKASGLRIKRLSVKEGAYRHLLESVNLCYQTRKLPRETAAVLGRMEAYLGINTETKRILTASLGLFPTGEKNIPHTRRQIETARKELQRAGILFSVKKSDGVVYDIIPGEIAEVLKKHFGMAMKKAAYERLISYVLGKYKKPYLAEILESFEVAAPEKISAPRLTRLVGDYISPRDFLSGKGKQQGLDRRALADWCEELGLGRQGSREALMEKLFSYYEHLADTEVKSDYRIRHYEKYAAIGAANYRVFENEDTLRDLPKPPRLFGEMTNYIFEVVIAASPDRLLSEANLSGRIPSEGKTYLYGAVSSEFPVDISPRMGEIAAAVKAEKGGAVAAYILAAPAFTEESVKECVDFYAENDVQICLIKAAQLKELADYWAKHREGRAFPMKYLRQNGFFDSKGITFNREDG